MSHDTRDGGAATSGPALEPPGGRASGMVPGWLWMASGWLLLIWGVFPLAGLKEVPGDEGLELAKAALYVEAGQWSADWWNDQPLTHTRLYAVLLGWFPGASGPRGWSSLSSAVLVASLGHMAQVLGGRRATGLLAIAWWGVAPQVAELSVAAMQEMPATAWGMAAVGLVTSRRPVVPWWRFGLAAAVGAGAMCIKLTAVLYVGAAFLMVMLAPGVANRSDPGGRVAAWLYLLLTLVVFRVALGCLDPRPVCDLLVPHLVALPRAWEGPPAHGHTPLSYVLTSAPVFGVAAAVGGASVLIGALKRGEGDCRWLALPIAVTLFNAVIQPWWLYYSLSVWSAFAPFAARGTEVLMERPWCAFNPGGWRRAAWMLPIAGVLLAAGWFGLLRTASANLWMLANGTPVSMSRVQEAIRRGTGQQAGASMFSVNPSDVFWSGGRVPGDLLVVTAKRFLGGDLDSQTLAARLRDAAVDVLVLSAGDARAPQGLWPRVLGADYVLAEQAEGREVYIHRRHDPDPYESRLRW